MCSRVFAQGLPLKLPARLGCLACAWDHLRPSGSGTSFLMSRYAPCKSMSRGSPGTAKGAVAAARRGSDGLSHVPRYCKRESSSKMSSICERCYSDQSAVQRCQGFYFL